MKISIITVTYNSEKTLEETVKSVISQDYMNIEYIIVDGGSTDGTKAIMEKYKEYIAISISEPDNGISDAFNKGIVLATGDIIGIINSDDVLYPHALSKVNRTFENDPDLDIVYGNTVRFKKNINDGFLYKPDTDLSKMKNAFLLSHPSIFITAKAYTSYGVFSCEYKCAMDYELIARMYYAGAKFMYLDAVLSGFREGGESLKKFEKTLQEHEKIATTNGAAPKKIKRYIRKMYVYQMLISVTQKLHIEKVLRRILKKQGRPK